MKNSFEYDDLSCHCTCIQLLFLLPHKFMRYDFCAFMKMDPKEDKDVLDKMLSTLHSDALWNVDDPYENACNAGGLMRYHFGLSASVQSTVFEQKKSDISTTSTDLQKLSGAPALQDGASSSSDVLIKLEHAEEQKAIDCKAKELNKVEKEITSLIVAMRKTKGALTACKKKEGDML